MARMNETEDPMEQPRKQEAALLPAPGPPPPTPGHWLDLLPAAWLLLAIAGYALLALQPTLFPDLRPRDAVPGIAELERLVLPMLGLLLLAAAFRRFRSGRESAEE
jgi:hypothetical protein